MLVVGPLVCIGEPTVPAYFTGTASATRYPLLDEQALRSLRDGLVDIEHHTLTPVLHGLRIPLPVQLRSTTEPCTAG